MPRPGSRKRQDSFQQRTLRHQRLQLQQQQQRQQNEEQHLQQQQQQAQVQQQQGAQVQDQEPLLRQPDKQMNSHNGDNAQIEVPSNDSLKTDLLPRGVRELALTAHRDVRDAVHKEVQDMLEGDLYCAICREIYINPLILNCAHSFCRFCLNNWLSKQVGCPSCRMVVVFQTENLALKNIVNRMVFASSPEFKNEREQTLVQRSKAELAQIADQSAKPLMESRSFLPSGEANLGYEIMRFAYAPRVIRPWRGPNGATIWRTELDNSDQVVREPRTDDDEHNVDTREHGYFYVRNGRRVTDDDTDDESDDYDPDLDDDHDDDEEEEEDEDEIDDDAELDESGDSDDIDVDSDDSNESRVHRIRNMNILAGIAEADSDADYDVEIELPPDSSSSSSSSDDDMDDSNESENDDVRLWLASRGRRFNDTSSSEDEQVLNRNNRDEEEGDDDADTEPEIMIHTSDSSSSTEEDHDIDDDDDDDESEESSFS